MNKTPAFLFALALSAALSACSGTAPRQEPPLEGARIGGAFSLTDQDGQTVSDTDFAGKHRIIYFGYSFCPDVCPIDLQKIAAGFALFEKQQPERAAKIQPIFITIDPERDTPAVLKQYVSAFHPRLIGLTGTPEQIKAVADAYLVMYKAQKPEGGDEGAGYLVDHSRQAYLMGPKGEPIALLPYDESPEKIAAEIDKWTA
ncbi:SCO family protein [Blastomonas sp.]|uniref:SCO family protein n=1 Tax=Blastomonas sp. TaxID=1909299 RepID=UPI00391B3430